MISRIEDLSVSAVIALYNGEAHITDAIDSIVNQDHEVFEILIVNDGSTDKSVEVINNYLARNPRAKKLVKVIEQKNSGQGSSRNTGVLSANGVIIGFLDQDDTWEPNHISQMLPLFLGNSRLGWVYSDFNEFDEHDRFIRRQFLSKHQYSSPSNSIFGLIEKDLMMLPSASLIRREAFNNVGGFDTQFRGYEDDDLFLRMFVNGWTYEYIPQGLVNYRIHPNNSSRNLSFPESRIKFYRKYKAFFDPNADYYLKFYNEKLVPRMVSAALTDATNAARNKDLEAHKLAYEFLCEIYTDVGRNSRNRFALFVAKRPRLLQTAVKFRKLIPRSSKEARNYY